MNAKFKLSLSPPSPEDFANLRASVGWTNPSMIDIENSLTNSLFWVTVHLADESHDKPSLVATGRIIGDGAMYFYIQDVIVNPLYQGQQLGHKIMAEIELFLARNCQKGATIGLLAAHGKEAFYQQYGYCKRDGEKLGLGMCKFI